MNPYDYSEEKHISPRRLLDFTLCTNPLGPSNKARAAMRKVVREMGTFPDEKARYLRRFLSRKEGIPPESFLFGHGSSHVFSVYLQTFRPPAVSLPQPCSARRALLLEQLGIRCEFLGFVDGQNGFTLDRDQVLEQAAAGKTLVLTNPHDLTGATISSELVGAVIEAVEQAGGMVFIDEAFIEFTDLASAGRQAAQSPHCLVLRSLSLFHALAGLRIGYGIGHPSLIERLAQALPMAQTNSMALAAARASVADKGYFKRTDEYIAAEKAYMLDKLQHLKGLVVRDTPCNFILVHVEEGLTDIEELFLKRSIFIGTFRDSQDKLWMRVPMRRRPQNARFAKTLRYLLSMPKTP